MELKKILLAIWLLPVLALGQMPSGIRGNIKKWPLTAAYATFNPNTTTYMTARATLSNGNLTFTHGSGGDGSVRSTLAIDGSQTLYMEFTIGTATTITTVGIANRASEIFDMPGRCSCEWVYRNDGSKMNGGTVTAYGASWTSGDVISLLLDLSAGTLVFYKNGSTQGTAFSSLNGGGPYWIKVGSDDNTPASVITANFGATSFTYSVPGGYTSGLFIYAAVNNFKYSDYAGIDYIQNDAVGKLCITIDGKKNSLFDCSETIWVRQRKNKLKIAA